MAGLKVFNGHNFVTYLLNMIPIHRYPSTILAFILLGPMAQAQLEQSVFNTTGRGAALTFVTDYQSVGINPANLGWQPKYEGKTIAFGFIEGSYSLHSTALTKSRLRSEIFQSGSSFSWSDKQDAARAFADAGFVLNADVMFLGASYHGQKWGGLGFQIRDHAQWSSKFNKLVSELIFQGSSADYFDLLVLASGDTISNPDQLTDEQLAQIVAGIATHPQPLAQLLNGSHLKATWYREYNLSYGKALVQNDGGLDLYAGVGVKYLIGVGIIDIRADGNEFNAFSSLSPDFNIDYGNGVGRRGSRQAFFPEGAGKGWGFDLGLSAIVNDRIKLAASVNNIGSIEWTGNAFRGTNAVLENLTTNGLENYNLFDGIDDFVTNSGLLEWDKVSSQRIALPTNLRVGGGYIVNEQIEVGLDVLVPLNDAPGNFEKPLFGIGGHVMPVKWLQLSAGISGGGDYGTKVPLGITFIAGQGTWEAGIASRDVVTFLASEDPTLSLALGFLRFRF